MSAFWIIYFAGISGGMCFFLFWFSVLMLIAFFAKIDKAYDGNLKRWRSCFIPLILSVLSMVACIIIPNEKTIYLMMGTKTIEDIARSPEAKEISGKILKVINEKLNDQIKDKK